MCSCIARFHVFIILIISTPGNRNAVIARLRAGDGLWSVVIHFSIVHHVFAQIRGRVVAGMCGLLALVNSGMLILTGWFLFAMRVPCLFILEAFSAAASAPAM